MTREVDRQVGQRVRAFRLAVGWSQDALARRVGCTQAALSQWERGIHALTLEFAVLIATALDIDVTMLLSPDDLSRDRYLRATRGPSYLA